MNEGKIAEKETHRSSEGETLRNSLREIVIIIH